MPIELPRGLPFSVDTWSPNSNRKRHHFLTHAHKDHTSGILTHSCYPIYTTHLTKLLVLQNYPQLEDSLFVGIEVGESVVINDPDGEFKVTAFDANHCPGAVMFLFEGNFGNILHTGDCRLTPEGVRCLPEKYISKKGKEPRCQLDYVFLDCTFGKFTQKLPSKHSAIQQVLKCIWKHPAATVVYLTCDLLGQEDILAAVSETFGSKIFVDDVANMESFRALKLTVPEILTQDPSSRFHLFDGFPRLYERAAAKIAEAQANLQPQPLIIRPSAQWYACEEGYSETESQRKPRFNEAVRDPNGVWHVCYSMHSSRGELEWALQLLAPKWVVSTTPSCLAVELDYVKKHCSGTKLTLDNRLWKLLDINDEASLETEVTVSVLDYPSVVEGSTQISAESQSSPVKVTSRRLLGLSPAGRKARSDFVW
ncbi:DNA CROSS-LINK REPAIR PROTEIN PSO2/SNM1-RELATED [Salix koriyanagi]|uniref:DNA CROSS-LINK REPAIR PROTEIN PSO2/SNM1-RELATED n=1 Tax=Salix koriyanagi TaxID=2511006 RepID=A0A9Q0UP09_9ROSI|nr:DNA CROSS-LINK REPAIR PROTEIN PSO2/SNM1-RELATED [Salix koriyanagi]